MRQKTCHRCKETFQISSSHFNRLELQCKENETMKGSIEECLELFTQPEVMKGDNQVFCENCNDKCDMTFATCIDSLPNVLPLHLKRFDLDLRTFRTVKLNQRISFPLELDMHPYTESGIKERERRRKRKERHFEGSLAKTRKPVGTNNPALENSLCADAAVLHNFSLTRRLRF